MLTEQHLVQHGVPQALAQQMAAARLTPGQWLQIIQAILAGLGPILGGIGGIAAPKP